MAATVPSQDLEALALPDQVSDSLWYPARRSATGLPLRSPRSARDLVLPRDPGYLHRTVQAIAARAGHPLADPQEAVQIISHRLRFTDAQQAGIMAHFIPGGDTTAGGILHDVTSAAQTQSDADTAHDMEAAGLSALEIAATL